MSDKAVNTYHSTKQFVPECYKTQEMCDKAVNRCFLLMFMYVLIPDCYKTQEMCYSVASETLLLLSFYDRILPRKI